MPDVTQACRDCGNEFVFTAEEQRSFAEKGFNHPPSRCQSCREARKANRDANPSRSPFGGQGGTYVRREREMFPAVCSSCGKDTQVPFQPRGDRPVYCSDCYSRQQGYAVGGRSR